MRRLLLLCALALGLSACPEPDFSVAPDGGMVTPEPTRRPTPEVSDDPRPTPPASDDPRPTPEVSDDPRPTPAVSDEPDPTPTPPVGVPPIVGVWLSEGQDVSKLFRDPPVSLVRIDAQFEGDGAYTVVAQNDNFQVFEFEGTYTVDTGTNPHTIVLRQQTPTQVVSEGIWFVQGDVMTYEIAQTEPPQNGVSRPSVAGGFGSTSDGALGMDNVQTYRRVRQ